MILRHKTTITGQPVQYVARIKNGIIYLTIPRAVFHGSRMHIVTRAQQIHSPLIVDTVAGCPKIAWPVIGNYINDVYLMQL